MLILSLFVGRFYRKGQTLSMTKFVYDHSHIAYQWNVGSSGGRVVKVLACGARGPGFDSRPRHLNFQRLVISCFQVEIWLKGRLIDVNPQNNQPTNQWNVPVFFQYIYSYL